MENLGCSLKASEDSYNIFLLEKRQLQLAKSSMNLALYIILTSYVNFPEQQTVI